MKRIGEILQDTVDGFYEGMDKTWPLIPLVLVFVCVYALAILATSTQPTREKNLHRLECTCKEIPPSEAKSETR